MSEVKISTILDLIKNNNKTGFELLYSEHYKFLFSVAFTVTRNEEDSKDIVQNVMYKLSKMSKNSFPNKGEISWLHRVVKNEAIDYIKSKKVYANIDEIAEIQVSDKAIDDMFDMDSYYSLIESLNEKQKEVVTLKVLGGLSHKEIAKTLDKPIGTIQWIYNTSIKQLRVALATMASFVFVLLGGLTYRGKILLDELNGNGGGFSTATVPEQPSNEDVLQALLSDNLFIGFGIAFVLLIIALVIFYSKSDKLPTKQKR